MAEYTVFEHGRILHGDARAVLERIHREASRDNDEIRKMNLEQYADAIIEDAEFFVDPELLKALSAVPFETTFDRALSYLAQVPTSGIHIMTVRAA